MKNFFASAGRVLLTLVVVVVAIAVAWQLWSYYMLEPWTRDGRVRADVVPVAADVSGLISDVFVHDNEKVSKGQQLFRIDQRRFQYALDQAKADVASRQATLDQAKRDLERSKNLTSLATTVQPTSIKLNSTPRTRRLKSRGSISSARRSWRQSTA